MQNFSIPKKEEVNESNQKIFDSLEENLGFVPNLYAYYAKNETALKDYLQFQNRKTTLTKKEIEVVNLVVSQKNACVYCLSAHTVVAGKTGFDDNQIVEIRRGKASFDHKLNALAEFTETVVAHNGKITEQEKDAFFKAGYTEANLIDVIMKIGDKTISNLIHNISNLPVDFPEAPALEKSAA